MQFIEELSTNVKPRLIPTSKKTERRLLSVFISILDLVPDYRKVFLERCGYKSGKTCNFLSRLEPAYYSDRFPDGQPDGLLVCTRGKASWSAFIEAKSEKNKIRPEQIKDYCQLASKVKINAVISISNEYSRTPQELPYHIKKTDKRGRSVFHFCWAELRTFTEIFINEASQLTDLEQKLLHEFSQFLWDQESGILTYDAMPENWSHFVESAGTQLGFPSKTPGLTDLIHGWQQEKRDLCAKLIYQTGRHVDIFHDAGRRADRDKRLQYDRKNLTENSQLVTNYAFQDSTTVMRLIADLRSCRINIIVGLMPPKGKKAKASVNWISKTLQQGNFVQEFVSFDWQGKTPDTTVPVSKLFQSPIDVYSGKKEGPKCIRLISEVHEPRKFKSRKKFIEILEGSSLKLANKCVAVGLV